MRSLKGALFQRIGKQKNKEFDLWKFYRVNQIMPEKNWLRYKVSKNQK
jgi:hypothetical protein